MEEFYFRIGNEYPNMIIKARDIIKAQNPKPKLKETQHVNYVAFSLEFENAPDSIRFRISLSDNGINFKMSGEE